MIGELFARVDHRLGRLPGWVRVLVGGLCAVVGAVLTIRPFTSLGALLIVLSLAMIITGGSELLDVRRGSSTRLDALSGIGWVLLGLVVLAWPAPTLVVIRWWVGISMILSGLLRAGSATRTSAGRLASLLSAAASVVFGLLALAWPDVTILLVAVLFGARTTLAGLLLLAHALFPTKAGRHDGSGARTRRWPTVRAVGALVVALALLAVSVALHRASPTVDAFYQAPQHVPSTPGQLLRSEPFTRGIPDTATAWRILYTTTTTAGAPTVASGIVLIGKGSPPGPRPVVAWAHGTTGYARNCAPSLLADPFGAGAMPDLDQVIAQHWVLVATDYAGLGTSGAQPYLIGQGEARSVLDSVRAARQLRDVSMSRQTVVWGHSQGGGAALWTGQIQPAYAPDVPLAGVAAMAPASDLRSFASTIDSVPGGSIFMSFVITAYAASYPDVHESRYVRPAARVLVEAAAGRCLSEPSTLVSVAAALGLDKSIMSDPADSGPLGERLQENTATGTGTTPLLLAQGGADTLIPPEAQRAYARSLCARGGQVDYREYPGQDHVGIVSAGSPLLGQLISWTQARLAGDPPTDSCPAL